MEIQLGNSKFQLLIVGNKREFWGEKTKREICPHEFRLKLILHCFFISLYMCLKNITLGLEFGLQRDTHFCG